MSRPFPTLSLRRLLPPYIAPRRRPGRPAGLLLSGLLLSGVLVPATAAAQEGEPMAAPPPPATSPAAAPSPAQATAVPMPDSGAWQRSHLWGGDVRSLAFDPRDPERVFAGTSGGHVYRSTDGGRTWADAGAALALPGWVVSDLDFDPDIPGRLWAALWGTWGGGMVVVSDDDGSSWQVRGYDDLKHTQVYVVARVPGSATQGSAGADATGGTVYAGTLSGVWGSTDGGETWRRLTRDLPEVHKVTSLLVGPEDSQRVVAGTWERAYRSDDGGVTWYGIFEGMVLDSEVFTLTAVPGRPNEWWASTCGWVYSTRDAGGRWQRHSEGFENRRSPAFNVLPGGRLLAGTVAGLHLSGDDGRTWRRTGPADLAIYDIAYHPRQPDTVLVATGGSGVWRSEAGGVSLGPSSEGMRNLRVAALVKAGREVLVALNHAGPDSGVHASRDGGVTFAPDHASLPTVRDLVVHGISVYAATERGLWERAGGSWRQIGEIGDARVEAVDSAGGRLVVRTGDGLWEQDGPRFRRVEYHHGRPRSAALAASGDALWVSDAEGLYRLTEGANDTVEVPFPGGRVERLGSRLAWWGKQGLWLRPGASDPWIAVSREASEVLLTGDERFPALVLSAVRGSREIWLLDGKSGERHPVEFPLPAEEVISALVHRPSTAQGGGDRLLLGTAGHGLYWAPLP